MGGCNNTTDLFNVYKTLIRVLPKYRLANKSQQTAVSDKLKRNRDPVPYTIVLPEDAKDAIPEHDCQGPSCACKTEAVAVVT